MSGRPVGLSIPAPPGFTSNLGAQSAEKPYSLLDPISAKKYGVHSIFEDRLLELTPWQNLKLGLKNTFVTIPKAVWSGLRGDSSYSFSDFLNITKIPYFAGGLFLIASFRAGGDVPSALRQGIGVGLYYLGVMGANKLINSIHKKFDGIDLDLKYRKANGNIEKVFASADFPRFDLLKDKHWELIRQKQKIPAHIADPKRAMQEETKRVISDSRVEKLVLGNLLAAVGAGYLARSDGWLRLLGNTRGLLKSIFNDSKLSLGDKLAYTGKSIGSWIGDALQEKLKGLPNEATPGLRKGVLGILAVSSAYVLWHALNSVQNRQYESPGASLSPQLLRDSGQLSATSQGLFDTFKRARQMGGSA